MDFFNKYGIGKSMNSIEQEKGWSSYWNTVGMTIVIFVVGLCAYFPVYALAKICQQQVKEVCESGKANQFTKMKANFANLFANDSRVDCP